MDFLNSNEPKCNIQIFDSNERTQLHIQYPQCKFHSIDSNNEKASNLSFLNENKTIDMMIIDGKELEILMDLSGRFCFCG